MALSPLATADDLASRGIDTGFDELDKYLAIASSAVRAAAGSPIAETTSTITLDGYVGEEWIRLPGAPVREVTEVLVDGEAVDDWRNADGRLWRPGGWARGGWRGRPSEVTVTYTHGLPEVPEYIIDLVCAMVVSARAALDADDDGMGFAIDNGRVQSVTIDGFTEAYATSGDAIEAVTAMTLPARTRRWLASEFGGGTSTVSSR